MSNPKFIHLNVHSDYSIRDSICKINLLLKKSYYLNIPCIALTDYFNLSGVIKFFNKSLFYGIKPILGSDICIFFNNINSINFSTLLILNEIGYKNLIKIISIAHKCSNNSLFLSINYNLLCKYSEGLILLYSINYYSYNTNNFFFYNLSLFYKHVLYFKKYFNDRIYLQIFKLNHNKQDIYIKDTILCSNETNVNLVCTNKVLFLEKDDFYINKIRSSIYYGCTLNKIKYFIDYTNECYLKSEFEMFKLFKDIECALYNTIEISERCNFILKKSKLYLPKFSNIKCSSNYYLKKIVFCGLKKRFNFKKNDKLKYKYLLRIKKELNIIYKLNISNYFLIVMEFVKWSKNNNIFVGPGRGSGAGSLVAYLIYITDIDPIKFDLLFERFLNLERKSMPDFDIDFCMKKRDYVLSHIENLYGKNSVAQIVTFNTMTAKSVLRDVGRILGYSYSYVDYVVKLIPFDLNINLKRALYLESKLNYLYNSDKNIKYLIDISLKLEGIIKSVGKHAGGIVISPKSLVNFCPFYYDKDNSKLVTQFDKNDIKYIGLIKFDLLGLRTLTVIDSTIKMINFNKYFNSYLNINNINLDDKKSFLLLRNCKTIAVFQLESNGMRELIKKIKPKTFNDIVDLLALYRPGPLKSGMVDNYINRKNGNELIYYPNIHLHNKFLIPILKSTYGIILYQEQVMKIAQVLASYSLDKADDLRIAISEKNLNKMKLHKYFFVKGCSKLNININLSSKIFSLIENFASYGFNKSHSVCYSLLAYQTLWLKCNFTPEYLSSYINSDISNIKKVILIISEIKKFGIKLISPNINLSDYYFRVNKNKEIVYGLGAIKGIGKSSIKNIINIRNKYGKFHDFVSFCFLVYNKKLTKLVLEKLIFSGSLDIFCINRSVLFKYIKDILLIIKNKKKNIIFNQLNLFNKSKIFDLIIYKKIKNDIPIFSNFYLLNKEKEVLGFYMSDHPVNKYLNFVSKYNIIYIKNLFYSNKINFIKIFGLITSIKFVSTKKNNRICIINLDDNSDNIDLIIFKNIYLKYYNFIDINNIIIVSGFLKKKKYNYFLVKKINLINY